MNLTEEQQAYQQLKKNLANRLWRLNNLYYIKTETGEKVKFKLNWAQEKFYNSLWYFNVVLKARQLGFTTFILIYFLDSCLFNSNHAAGVIAHTREDAEDLFKNKVKFAYDNLPDFIKNELEATQDTARKIEFKNGSSITVGTSLRSGTYQKLLVSEYGKISARYPEKAQEIKTGALNTVHAGQQIFIESTAEGKSGEFYNFVQLARKLQDEGKELTVLDPAFHFYAWWQHPSYKLDDTSNSLITHEMQEYFNKLDVQGIKLTPQQKGWYVKKIAIQGDMMKREFPSTPDEAFEASLEGAYYNKEMTQIRKQRQIGKFPHEPSQRVYTFWDIGLNDEMAIWFFQHIGHEYRFIRYHEVSGAGWGELANILRSFYGYVYAEHYFPHDGATRVQGIEVSTRQELAAKVGIYPVKIVPRTQNVVDDIRNFCRPTLLRCSFDEQNCSQGIAYLDEYRKAWDEKLGQWRETPLHNRASNCADAFRTFAVGYKGRKQEFIDMRDRQTIYQSDYDMLNY